MRLGDDPVEDSGSVQHHNLSKTTDRRLVVLGSMSGAGVVITGSLLALAMAQLDVNPVAATSATIILLSGAAAGLGCGGVFSKVMVPSAKHKGLLGAVKEEPAWIGDGLDAWDTKKGEDIRIFRL
jgi:hypothetical protein